MNSIIAKIRAAAEKRALYYRTVSEIERMPLDVALDLGIFPGDSSRIAHKAVYGV